ncbi:MAG: NUMOD3 domain-containing DNA-binding protein [Nanoarchaeota archaeon]
MINKKCKCGCSQEIIIKPYHKYYGIPNYIQGHSGRINKFPKNELIKCKCGCENTLQKYDNRGRERKYIVDHKPKMMNGKTNDELYGIEKAKEIRKKVSLIKKGKHYSPETEFKKGQISLRKGKHHTEKSKEMMKLAKLGKSYEERYGIEKANKIKRKQSESRKGEKNYFYGKKHSEEGLQKMRLIKTGKKHSEKTKKEMSIERKKRWQNPEYKEKHLKKILKGLMKRPTSFEKRIIDLCNRHSLPFKYVGNGEVLIGYKNPDFIETNGRKLLIEVYNNFHHKDDYENKRGTHFKKYGYDTIFIGEEEVLAENWEERCLNKINEVLIKEVK